MARVTTLTRPQQALLDRWCPGYRVVADHSWGLIGTYVLEIDGPHGRSIVKAADASDRHLAREIRAHREWIAPWTSIHRAPALLHADESARIIVTRFLPGRLVQGSTAELRPDTYRQAGALLALLHQQGGVLDSEYGRTQRTNTLDTLLEPHRLDRAVAAHARDVVESWPDASARLVPTHGDWQPRNWIEHDDVISAIDFGRAALRPAITDFVRLGSRQFRTDSRFEEAFVQGYGSDPREEAAWRRELFVNAIGTAVWAYQVGDEEFEREGHRLLTELLASE